MRGESDLPRRIGGGGGRRDAGGARGGEELECVGEVELGDR